MESASDNELVQIKNELAREIVKSLGKDAGAMHEFQLSKSELADGKIWIVKLLKLTELVRSQGEGRRLIKQGGIKINDERVDNPDLELQIEDGTVLSKGKKVKIKINLV